MKNSDKQKKLDLNKWFASIEAGKDKGGQMDYCEGCENQHPDGYCSATQLDKETNFICAKNSNKLDRQKREKSINK